MTSRACNTMNGDNELEEMAIICRPRTVTVGIFFSLSPLADSEIQTEISISGNDRYLDLEIKTCIDINRNEILRLNVVYQPREC